MFLFDETWINPSEKIKNRPRAILIVVSETNGMKKGSVGGVCRAFIEVIIVVRYMDQLSFWTEDWFPDDEPEASLGREIKTPER